MSLHVWFHLSEPLPVWCSELWGRKRSIGLFCLQTLICTGKQDQLPNDTVTFSLSTLPVCLTSLFQSLYILISLCENVKRFCLSVSSSSVCIPLLYLGLYHTLPSMFSSACYLITCASVFAAGLSLHVHSYDRQP